MKFIEQYREAYKQATGSYPPDSYGMTEDEFDDRCPIAVPAALKEYYLLFGHDPANTDDFFFILSPPENLLPDSGWMVYLWDDAGIGCTAIREQDRGEDDPIAYTGLYHEDEIEWSEGGETLSESLIEGHINANHDGE